MIVKGWFVSSSLHQGHTMGEVITIEMCFPNISYVKIHDLIEHDEVKNLDYIATLYTDSESNLPPVFRITQFFDKKPLPTKKRETPSKPASTPKTTQKPKAKAKPKEVKRTK